MRVEVRLDQVQTMKREKGFVHVIRLDLCFQFELKGDKIIKMNDFQLKLLIMTADYTVSILSKLMGEGSGVINEDEGCKGY